jgi:CubicO group peptidase (beta-lactamase class C family)
MANTPIDQLLEDAVATGTVPGAVGLVTNRDTVLYEGAVGVMDVEGHVPMRPDAIFRIKSMTKPVTSLAVMMLVDDGLVDLDAPAQRYLPRLEGREVLAELGDASFSARPAARPPTVRDLLRRPTSTVWRRSTTGRRAASKGTREA